MKRLSGALCAIMLFGGSVATAQRSHGDTLYVADRYISGKTTGAAFVAKFDSAEARTRMLRLDTPVATVRGRRWVLGDILVTLDLNANGYVGEWTVAGPREVIDAYVAQFRKIVRSTTPIYDSSVEARVVRCACGE